jgi:16S rRNA (guanine966-N2)-methyltransferase
MKMTLAKTLSKGSTISSRSSKLQPVYMVSLKEDFQGQTEHRSEADLGALENSNTGLTPQKPFKKDHANRFLVRPTRGRVSQAIFNVLQHRFFVDWSKTSVLDAFAGTGAFGFQALTLGAQYVAFVERDLYVASQISKRAVGLGLHENSYRVFNMDIMQFCPSSPFHVIFLDPPYFKGLVLPAVKNLLNSNATSLFVIECASKESSCVQSGLDAESYLSKGIEKVYGNTSVLFYTTCLV